VQTVTLIKGDGIGPEVVDSALRVLEAAGAELVVTVRNAGTGTLVVDALRIVALPTTH